MSLFPPENSPVAGSCASSLKRVQIFTDGACSGNPGMGGWGVVLIYGAVRKELHGGVMATTNNRMELTAAIEGLKALSQECFVDLYTDSVYVRSGILEWIDGWKARHWKTASKQPVKNIDLWMSLDEVRTRHKIDWHWIKGHAGHPGNERADFLSRIFIEEKRKVL